METQIIHWILQAVVAASILHAILPPYDVLNDFPTAQKYYKLLLAIMQYVALNIRTNVIRAYPSAKAALEGPAPQEPPKP